MDTGRAGKLLLMDDQVPGRVIRRGPAGLAILVGIAFAFLLGRALWRSGLPDGTKAVLYVWVTTLTVVLPISLGLTLLRPQRSWGLFGGGWLLAAGVIFPGSLLPVLPQYRDLPLNALCTLLCALLSIGGGVLLIRAAKRRGPPRHTRARPPAA